MIGRTASVRPTYDVVVVGLGITGSSALHHLSRPGLSVLGIDTRGPVHRRGSSHGQTRIFRRAYWEGDQYGPLLDRSLEGWRDLETACGEQVVVQTGGLFVGPVDSPVVRGSLETARLAGIAHELLSSDEIRTRFPAFNPGADEVGVYEPDASMLFAERARLGYLGLATEMGAHIFHGQAVRHVRSQAGGGAVSVVGDGWEVSAGAVVLTAGGWLPELLPGELDDWLTPMRIPVYELAVAESVRSHHEPKSFPVFLHETGQGLVYGLPAWQSGGGVRVGFHDRQLTPLAMDEPNRPPSEAERLELWTAARRLLPGLQSHGYASACVYTMSSDESFLIGRSEQLEGVTYASACSGHGFKFAPAIGEALAQIVLKGESEVDLTPFSARRPR